MRPPDKFDEVCAVVMAYCSERGWDKTNSSRSLAISLSLEANELLELYQWTEDPSGSVSELADELADILIYTIQFAVKNEIDLLQAVRDKVSKVRLKYPVDLFETDDISIQHKRWLEAKRLHDDQGDPPIRDGITDR
ncbi:MazG-like family protein [Mycobacteroides abscessus]|uniref:MazG-like family protein n=1 Tax=Mycobacteroides abscessus TaxID=36809 RepID=UPI0010396A4A|nr:MazG-like family protein [Mycobacteroides abscessus]MBN7381189.1 hypothetical protein [Mycobacteroides abscessus subsp. massiliense]